ncbi:MAG: hypothetical protein ACI8S6_004054 [Myxococcota bacterium]|jgi:hypothetical protein
MEMHASQLAALRAQLTSPQVRGLAGRFHSHITVRADPDVLRLFCAGRALKVTVIDLADFAERQQRDVMTTAYHCGTIAQVGEQLAATAAALQAVGLPPVRIKLEHESLPTIEPFSKHCYREIHLKLSIPEATYPAVMARLRAESDRSGCVPSRNPYQRREGQVIQFVNLRIYEGDLAGAEAQTQALVAALSAPGDLRVIEVKSETTVIDTAQALDSWWA